MTDYETPCKHGYWRECSECDVQAAIDAALESVKQKIYNRGEVSMKAGLPAGAGFYAAIDIIETAVGTNPLAERDARIAELEAALVDARNSITSWISENEEKIAELESLLGEAYADADDVLRPRIAELEADNTKLTKKLEAGWVRVCQTGLVEAHDRIAELERQLVEVRKDVERYEAKLFALGAMEEPPCFKCGYNGPGYFQTATHPCAHNHHNAMLAEREEE